MNRLVLAVALAPTLLLAACGGTACTSTPATPQNTNNPSCSVAAGQTVTVDVALCGKCTDTSPSCQAEFRNGTLEVAPTVEQCQEQAGCNISGGCDITPPHATCSVTIPAGTISGTPIVILGDQTYNATLNIGSGTTCNL
ncbi:MAG TPA: hypothetical protein VM683_05505 [Anaeromyxobacteraceae bacterium]|nr:hypothetical protein [Anaeromyxobacteraceae bacterium]